MADDIRSTIPAAPKDRGYKPSAISTTFSALLGALARHVEAERDIKDVDIWDPAFRNWLTDAEEAHATVARTLSDIRATEIARAEDKPLMRMAMLLDHMTCSEEPGAFWTFRPLLMRFDSLFRCPGEDPVAVRVNRMLISARARIDEMAALDLYAPAEGQALPQEIALEDEIPAEAPRFL